MNHKEFVETYLSNCQIGNEVSDKISDIAKENDLIIVYGASDDLTELRGAIDDEVSAFGGDSIYFVNGKLLHNECDNEDCPHEREIRNKAHVIKACWCEDDTCSWSFKTEIPHSEFLVYEEGELFCKGIVFSIKDIK